MHGLQLIVADACIGACGGLAQLSDAALTRLHERMRHADGLIRDGVDLEEAGFFGRLAAAPG